MTLSSPRIGKPTWLRTAVARLAVGRRLTGFVAPGREVALAMGVDLEAAGLHLVANARHAEVLVLAGPVPAGLQRAVALTYAQMPRPRAVLSIGSGHVAQLPPPDAEVSATQAGVQAGVSRLSALFADGAWARDAMEARVGGVHDMAGMDMEHVAGHDTAAMDMEPTAGHDLAGVHMDMDHMAGGGFMSMIMMTKDLPRSPDGLPMEWLEVPFGPLFPGLPGGLGLSLTLDGDTVAGARVDLGALSRGLEATWLGPVAGFVDRFATLDPLSPMAYRVLAERALAAATGVATAPVPVSQQRSHVAALERERAASHLAWLAKFAFLLGDRWLEERAATLRVLLANAGDLAALRQVRTEAGALVRQTERLPLLARRLGGVGQLDSGRVADLYGPVARAAGVSNDVRSNDPMYEESRFQSVTAAGGDALARTRVRLTELEQSLDLLLAGIGNQDPVVAARPPEDGIGQAAIETPRGAATLRIVVRERRVVEADLSSPSQQLVQLVGPVANARELADALLGVASLDISPWEIDR